ncbi:HAMP domain-containing histidine kinase [bacterium]|nr:HAMP domain-containing histidine kinase [bacterium]
MADRSDRAERGAHDARAPVEYASIRVPLQSVRLLAAVTLIVLAATSSPLDVRSLIRMFAFGLLGLDALSHLAFKRPVSHVLTADAILLTTAIGMTAGSVAPAVLLVAYFVVASALLLPPRLAGLVLLPVVLGIGARAVFHPFEIGTSAQESDLYDVAAAMVAITFLALAASGRLRAAAKRQAAALETERRASEMKNEFVSMVSHELRTPLTNISGFALAAQESWRSIEPDEVDEFLGIICSEADHLKNLVDDILTIPRLDAGRLRVDTVDFHLRPAAFRIADIIFPQGGEHSASVSVPGSAVVLADPNRVEQVLRNLLENARKYGGNEIQIEAIRHPDELVVTVADTGPGVPEADRERIFDRFEQMSSDLEPTGTGLGLGLTISRRLIEAMGGRIWYEPGFPVGARFCFTLPVGDPVAAIATAPSPGTEVAQPPAAAEAAPPVAVEAAYSGSEVEPTLQPSETGVDLTA